MKIKSSHCDCKGEKSLKKQQSTADALVTTWGCASICVMEQTQGSATYLCAGSSPDLVAWTSAWRNYLGTSSAALVGFAAHSVLHAAIAPLLGVPGWAGLEGVLHCWCKDRIHYTPMAVTQPRGHIAAVSHSIPWAVWMHKEPEGCWACSVDCILFSLGCTYLRNCIA